MRAVGSSIVKSLRLLSDPTRLRLLLLLGRAELSVAELQQVLAMGQSRISSHLAGLRAAGLVRARRSGKHVYYRAASAPGGGRAFAQLLDLVRESAREIPQTASDRLALQVVLRRRGDRAREFFNRVAGRFGRDYSPGRSWEALSHMLLGLLPPLVVADLGAGEGVLAVLLARRVRRVIAVDSSERMIEVGTQLARENGCRNVEYRLGDLIDPPIRSRSVDVAVFSQALHHAADPGRALRGARRVLKPGGRVVVLDLLAHSYEQARERYADLWLGFGQVDLHRMLVSAGFEHVEVAIVSRERARPGFSTLLAMGTRP